MVEDFKRGDEPKKTGTAALVEEFKRTLASDPSHPSADSMRAAIAEFEKLQAFARKLAGD